MKWPVMKTRRTGGHSPELDCAWNALYEQANARLAERIERHQIPIPDTCPVQDLVLVYRIPNEYQGTLVLPENAEERHDSPFSIGVLLLAGPEAMGVLESHGIMPGDYVHFAKFAGEEEAAGRIQEAIDKGVQSNLPEQVIAERVREARSKAMNKKKLLRIQVPLIHQSVDLFERRFGEKPTMQMIREVDAKGRVLHVIEPVIENIL